MERGWGKGKGGRDKGMIVQSSQPSFPQKLGGDHRQVRSHGRTPTGQANPATSETALTVFVTGTRSISTAPPPPGKKGVTRIIDFTAQRHRQTRGDGTTEPTRTPSSRVCPLTVTWLCVCVCGGGGGGVRATRL